MHPIATIIIPQHNQAHLTIACLQSLRQHEPARLEFIVIDDGSDPDAVQPFDSLHFPKFQLIHQSHTGITAAWNNAARHATSPHLIFLNNDTVCHGPIVDRLISPLSSTAILTGPKLRRESALPSQILHNLPTQCFIEGWCMSLLRDDFEKIGHFDESMKLYFSDTDLQSRLLKAHQTEKLKLQPIPNLPIQHTAHQTARTLPHRRQTWNSDRQTFTQKWQPKI